MLPAAAAATMPHICRVPRKNGDFSGFYLGPHAWPTPNALGKNWDSGEAFGYAKLLRRGVLDSKPRLTVDRPLDI